MSKVLYIFLVERTDDWHYDEFVSIVVAATSHKHAALIEPKNGWHGGQARGIPSLKVTRIGIAVRGVREGEILHTYFYHA